MVGNYSVSQKAYQRATEILFIEAAGCRLNDDDYLEYLVEAFAMSQFFCDVKTQEDLDKYLAEVADRLTNSNSNKWHRAYKLAADLIQSGYKNPFLVLTMRKNDTN